MNKQVDGIARCFGSFVHMRRLPAVFLNVPDDDVARSDAGEAADCVEGAVAGRVVPQETCRFSTEEPGMGRARCA